MIFFPIQLQTSSTPLLPILAFMQTLINGKSELRVLIDPKKESIKALLLNPASQFTELVTKCRSIIVAGGTMQPISEFRDRLFVQAGIHYIKAMELKSYLTFLNIKGTFRHKGKFTNHMFLGDFLPPLYRLDNFRIMSCYF